MAWLWLGDVRVQVRQRSPWGGMSAEHPLQLDAQSPAKAAPWQRSQGGWACLLQRKCPSALPDLEPLLHTAPESPLVKGPPRT